MSGVTYSLSLGRINIGALGSQIGLTINFDKGRIQIGIRARVPDKNCWLEEWHLYFHSISVLLSMNISANIW